MIKRYRQACILLASGFGAGYSPIMPGTVGTLMAFPLFWFAQLWLTPFGITILALVLFFVAIPICQSASAHFKAHDASPIVIDEIIAMLLVLSLIPTYWTWQLIGFIVFRFFDIAKPFPIGYIDKSQSNAIKIMLDDIVAAIYTILFLLLCQWLWQNIAS